MTRRTIHPKIPAGVAPFQPATDVAAIWLVSRHRFCLRLVDQQSGHPLVLFSRRSCSGHGFAVRMWPLDSDFVNQLIKPLVETIHIATLGTFVTILIAFPVAFLAARNTTFTILTWFWGVSSW